MRGLSHNYARCANRIVRRKAACALVGAVAATTLLPSTAGAQDHRDLFWSLTASSSHVAHCVQGTVDGLNSNYVVCRIVWPYGAYTHVLGAWVDSWCELVAEQGDPAAYVPLVVRWRSTIPQGSCAPGAGVWLWADERYVSATEGWVFPRSAADPWSRSTVVEIR